VSPDTDDFENELTIEVPASLHGVRVDRAVAMVADVSRAAAATIIEEGRVSVDGQAVVIAKLILKEGSSLRIDLPDPEARLVSAEADVAFEVIHQDDAIVIVDKPAGLVVHPGAGNHEGTLVGGLLARFPELAELVDAGICAADRPGIVHRLDKGTSGLLAVARTADAYASLVAQLADRSMGRRYLALVEGDVVDNRGEIDAPIGRSIRTPTKMAISAGGKPAITRYSVRQRVGRETAQPRTLLELQLLSGRTHQIRVHMAAIGHPVVGDPRYGTPDKRLGRGRFFLHAYELSLQHPVSGERVSFSSPLPADLAGYLEGG
jgi:23S rRNA pseudouridine1911/1915/1917 synthase